MGDTVQPLCAFWPRDLKAFTMEATPLNISTASKSLIIMSLQLMLWLPGSAHNKIIATSHLEKTHTILPKISGPSDAFILQKLGHVVDEMNPFMLVESAQ